MNLFSNSLPLLCLRKNGRILLANLAWVCVCVCVNFVSPKTDLENECDILLVSWFGLIFNKPMFSMSKFLRHINVAQVKVDFFSSSVTLNFIVFSCSPVVKHSKLTLLSKYP